MGYLHCCLSCWNNVLMCLKVAILEEVIILNLLFYTSRASQKYKSGWKGLFLNIFKHCSSEKKGEWTRRLTDVSFKYSGFFFLFPSATPSPHKWEEKSKNNLSKLSIYTKLLVVNSIYLIIEHIKNRFCLSTAPIFWAFICGSGDCRQWEAFLSYTLCFIPCSKLQYLIFLLNTTLELSVAFDSWNWFMADSPLLCSFMKNFVFFIKNVILYLSYIFKNC